MNKEETCDLYHSKDCLPVNLSSLWHKTNGKSLALQNVQHLFWCKYLRKLETKGVVLFFQGLQYFLNYKIVAENSLHFLYAKIKECWMKNCSCNGSSFRKLISIYVGLSPVYSIFFWYGTPLLCLPFHVLHHLPVRRRFLFRTLELDTPGTRELEWDR